jgi:hypothetical protein
MNYEIVPLNASINFFAAPPLAHSPAMLGAPRIGASLFVARSGGNLLLRFQRFQQPRVKKFQVTFRFKSAVPCLRNLKS